MLQCVNSASALAVEMVTMLPGAQVVFLLLCLIDTTAGCKDFPLFLRRSSVWVVLLPLIIGVTVNIVMRVTQRIVLKFMVRSGP